jgi:hypothetical protein
MEARMQRKICGAVLTLAASAFGVDHWMIGSDAAASDGSSAVPAAVASVSASPAAPRPAGKPAPGAREAKERESTAASSRSLAQRLQESADAEQLDLAVVPDAFRPSRLWEPPAPPAPPTPQAALPPPVARPDPGDQFRSRHKLTAVMQSGRDGGGMALINGKMVLPGQSVDGFTLVEVRKHSAVLSAGEAVAELALEGAKGP